MRFLVFLLPITLCLLGCSKGDTNNPDALVLIWSDEFDGETIDLTNWRFAQGIGKFGDNQLQNYTNGDNAEIINGKLVITTRKVDDLHEPGSYTSARLISKNKRVFMYGQIEVRARLPEGLGIWPGVWMLGSNITNVFWPACGEIDIVEYFGFKPDTVHSYIHTQDSYDGEIEDNGAEIYLETCEEEFHIYGIIWTKEYIKFYIDEPSNVTYTYQPHIKTDSNWPFNQTAYFILNIAVGGDYWGASLGIDNAIFPQTMEIDYVRVYQ